MSDQEIRARYIKFLIMKVNQLSKEEDIEQVKIYSDVLRAEKRVMMELK